MNKMQHFPHFNQEEEGKEEEEEKKTPVNPPLVVIIIKAEPCIYTLLQPMINMYNVGDTSAS